MFYQIEELPRGSILLFGRHTDFLVDVLQKRFGDHPKVKFTLVSLDSFSDQDAEALINQRQSEFPELKILDEESKQNIKNKTNRNPLLMDIALQALIESENLTETIEALETGRTIEQLQENLLNTYYKSLSGVNRHFIFELLAVARNGLFKELVKYLASDASEKEIDTLIGELEKMGKLPFVKVRNVFVSVPGEKEKKPRRTYFLHDEMYLLFDKCIKNTTFIRDASRKIVGWYDDEIQETIKQEKGHPQDTTINVYRYDLLVESLIYRLRTDFDSGYRWFLLQEDQAIRNSLSIGLDMRLRDGFSQFMVLAGIEKAETELNLASPIDTEVIRKNYASIIDQYPIDMSMLWIKRLSVRGNHSKAIEVGDYFYRKSTSKLVDPNINFLSLAELRLWYGQALMYSGNTDKAEKFYKECLQLIATNETALSLANKDNPEFIIRVGLVAGRANNNLGYLCWINEGKYRLAVHHLEQATTWYKSALAQVDKQDEFTPLLKEEIANSQDNLGRVFALLGHYSLAEDTVREGLESREIVGYPYRTALSQVSLATVQNVAGQLRKAQKTAAEAFQSFRKIESEARPSRGIGLCLIIKGSVARSIADQWREEGLDITDALDQVEVASTDLNAAIRIFRDSVEEPVRLIDAHNELACCKRAEYFLRSQDEGTSPKILDSILREGVNNFRRAVEIAKSINHLVEEVDSLQDLSVMYFRAKQLTNAGKCMDDIEKVIPNQYKIKQETGVGDLKKEDAVDAFYKTMGQVEMLRGAVTFENGIAMAKKQEPDAEIPIAYETFRETFQHYVFASEYFTHYSTESYSIQRTHGRMKSRLKHCRSEWVHQLAHEFIPQLEKEFGLKHDPVKRLLANVFGIIE
ncbi:MAG: tetratricopeptide repeat protein [Anaerolineales bacterium]|nr:tetratricopeptide repeat protein [Anaerolineales bacterium]